MSAKPVVLTASEWIPTSTKFMAPKVNDRGGKSINIISAQTNRSLHFSTPFMMTWGPADYVDEKGESDGKFSMTLNFPNEEYRTKETDELLQKLKDFENFVLDEAVKKSESWWGESMSREVAKHTFFPFLKYSKNKDTKKIDLTKPPSIRGKIPLYSGRWGVEIYDTRSNLIFPCENPDLTPVDFIPKMSSIACVLQCGGIWIGGKGWGLTWKVIQCVVKPKEVISVYGKCHIAISQEDIENQESEATAAATNAPEPAVYLPPALPAAKKVASLPPPAPVAAASNTLVEDSDEEEEAAAAPAEIVEDSVPEEPVVESAPVSAPAPVKKVIKKTTAPVVAAAAPAPEPVAEVVAAATAPVVKKKVVKKI
jgi:hypothetical protein